MIAGAVAVAVVYVLVAWFEVPGLVQRRLWGELRAFLVLDVLAMVLSILYALDVPLPNIIRGMQYLIEDVLHLTY